MVGATPLALGEFPWAGTFGIASKPTTRAVKYLGGVTMLAPNWAITAAHCLDEIIGFDQVGRLVPVDPDREFVIVLSAWPVRDTDALRQPLSVDLVMRHREFESNTLKNDIAVLRVVQSVRDVLPPALGAPAAGTKLTVWGGGASAGAAERPADLHRCDVIVRTDQVCGQQQFASGSGKVYRGDPATMLCAGGISHNGVLASAGICPGDSGGGLVAQVAGGWEYVGIASWTTRDCGVPPDQPDVYTSISAYRQWIDETVRSA